MGAGAMLCLIYPGHSGQRRPSYLRRLHNPARPVAGYKVHLDTLRSVRVRSDRVEVFRVTPSLDRLNSRCLSRQTRRQTGGSASATNTYLAQ